MNLTNQWRLWGDHAPPLLPQVALMDTSHGRASILQAKGGQARSSSALARSVGIVEGVGLVLVLSRVQAFEILSMETFNPQPPLVSYRLNELPRTRSFMARDGRAFPRIMAGPPTTKGRPFLHASHEPKAWSRSVRRGTACLWSGSWPRGEPHGHTRW